MVDLITVFIIFGVVALVLIFAVFCVCMYLEKFPFIKTNTETNVNDGTFKTEFEVHSNNDKRI